MFGKTYSVSTWTKGACQDVPKRPNATTCGANWKTGTQNIILQVRYRALGPPNSKWVMVQLLLAKAKSITTRHLIPTGAKLAKVLNDKIIKLSREISALIESSDEKTKKEKKLEAKQKKLFPLDLQIFPGSLSIISSI